MSSAVLKELMKEDIEAAYNDGERRGEERGEDAAQRKIILNMQRKGCSIAQISDLINMSTEDIEKIIQSESVLV